MKKLPFIRLVQIGADGSIEGITLLPALLRESLPQTKQHFEKVGYVPPWVGYVALDGEMCVGVCAFKTAPEGNRVEIAYGTEVEHRGKGYAKAMARELVRIAFGEEPGVVVAAQTLPCENESTAVLRTLGFTKVSEVQHPEDGLVWEWQLKSEGEDKVLGKSNIRQEVG